MEVQNERPKLIFQYNMKSILLCTSEEILEFDFPNSQDIHGQKVPEGMYMEKQ